jgi:thiol-disulfide isomerase/thioredoxin/tetratricopeptide (TPR) repeat protein
MNKLAVPLTLTLLALIPAMLFAQIFAVNPVQPKIGDRLTMTYDPQAPSAALKGAATAKAEAMLMFGADLPILVEVPLAKNGSVFTGTFELKNDAARLIIFRVVSGADQDNNGGNCWFTMVYGGDGKPLENACLQAGLFVGGNGIMEFKHEKNYPAAYAAFKQEKESYPSNWRVYTTEWSVMMRENKAEETKAKIKAALDSYYDRFKGNEDAVASALYWFDQTGQKDRGESLKKEIMEKNPKGPVAEGARRTAVYQERDAVKRADLLEKFLADFPQKGMMLDNMLSTLVSSYASARQPEKALAAIDRMASPNPNMLNSIAWGWIEKGENLDQAVAIAKKGVDLASNPSSTARPSYLSDQQWKEQSEYGLGMLLDTYAFGLYQQGKYAEAEKAFAESYRTTKGEQPEITERLLMTYNRNGKFAETMTVGKQAIESGRSSDKVLEYFKEAYTKQSGSDRGFDEMIASAKMAGAKQVQEKVARSRVNKPAVQFALKDVEGKTIKLSDLKGKVVVVDFWATWCGPCKMSFPTLQKVYEKYKSHPQVAIYALDTWENVGGKEKEELVKKFLADNKYTFPVLYDEGMVDKYGVEGIPTKFIIDKKGEIAFKSVGFNNADEMMSELTTQIDMLVAE